MRRIRIIILALAMGLIAQPALPLAGIPDLSHSWAEIAYTGPDLPSLLVVPDGQGDPFTEAHDESGNVVDATISLVLLDLNDTPIFQYPFEDLWLESADGGLALCIAGSVADANTDVNGRTSWVNPLFGGGSSHGPVYVMINGAPLDNNPGLPLRFNSPDMNGDLTVNLADISIFAGDYYTAPGSFRSDLTGDGVLNISDVQIFAKHLGANCP